MKILHIIDSGGLYGAEVMLLSLVESQIKIGLKPTIASISNPSIEEKAIESEAMRRKLPLKKFRMIPGPNIIGAAKMIQYANERSFDMLHSHGYKGNILFGFLPAIYRRIPIVTTLHGWTSGTKFTKMKIYEWIDALSLRYMDAVVLVNKEMLKHRNLKSRRDVNFHFVDNGIPLLMQKSASREKALNFENNLKSFCKNGFIVGTIGRLSNEKGHSDLIEAVYKISKNIKNIRLVILGEGNKRKQLEKQIARFNLADRVLMPGYVENAKDYLSIFDVFVLPSITEGLPITILEAMQARVPILSTAVGGVPEVLDDGKAGVLVNSQDTDSMANSLMQMYKDEDLRIRLVNYAAKRTREHYSIERMTQAYFRIYNQVIRRWKKSGVRSSIV